MGEGTISSSLMDDNSEVMRRRRRRRRRQIPAISETWSIAAVALLTSCGIFAAGDESSGVTNKDLIGFHEVKAFCNKNFIKVSGFYLTCDTPGAYYAGSNAYRNSEVCMSGDRARLRINLTIPNWLELSASPLITLESGYFDRFFLVINATNLCQMPIYGIGDEYDLVCPQPGHYFLKANFTVPQIRDYYFHYVPDIRMTFTDLDGNRVGCSTSGPVAIHQAAAAKAKRGLWALSISVAAFAGVFAVLLYLSYRRKKRLEKMKESQHAKQYHYFRSLANGQVIALPGKQLTSQFSTGTDGSSNGSISNPLYNETQLPTRPVI